MGNRMIEKLRAELPAGLSLTDYSGGVVNVTTTGREMTRGDVEEFRAALARNGYEELESWVATQGASWLSDGAFAGVSFRVREVARG